MKRWPFYLLPSALAISALIGTPGSATAATISGLSRTTLEFMSADADYSEDDSGGLFTEYLSLKAEGLPAEATIFASGALKAGMESEDEDSIYYNDVYEHSGDKRFYLYSAGVTGKAADLGFTLGRFDWRSVENVNLDGAALSYSVGGSSGFKLSTFGGFVVDLYDDLEDDTIFGLGLEFPLHPGIKFKANYMNLFDDLYNAELAAKLSSAVSAKLEAKWVEERLREVELKGEYLLNAFDARLFGNFKKKIGNYEHADYLYDYTSDASYSDYRVDRLNLDREAPYNQYRIGLDKYFGESFSISADYIKRDLIDEESYESSGNTSFDVYRLGFNLNDLLIDGFSLAARYSLWEEDRLAGYESSSSSYSIDVEQEIIEPLKIYASWYSKESDLNNQLENQVSEALTAGINYKGSEVWEVDASYSAETDDTLDELYGVEKVETFTTSLTLNF
ncbi:MAG: hypothetical protein C0609_11450 [Deltaproteobacteria bacterium]|nr:MAG: hypothetical protein C0609_11450 [Deltaproteobacteria bacterium]